MELCYQHPTKVNLQLVIQHSTGDMVGAYAPIKDIPKTLIYKISEFINANENIIPERIITRAPSAELKPNQTDQDSLPAYDELDKSLSSSLMKGNRQMRLLAWALRHKQ